MSKTVNEVFEMAIALIDSMTELGAVDTDNTADYKARTPFLVNLLQTELIKTGDLTAKYEVSYSPMANLLGDKFVTEEHQTVDISYECNEVANCYYFESDGASGTVYIEDYTTGWNVLDTVTLSNTGLGMMAYKDVLTPTVGATKSRIRFSGSYFYRYANFGLFTNSFSAVTRMYDYSPFVKLALPTTLHSIKEVIIEYSPQQYETLSDGKFELEGTTLSIFISNDFKGKIRVIYVPNPTKVTTTALSETLQIDDYSCMVMAYGLAEAFMNVEQNDMLTRIFNKKFNELKAESMYKKPRSAKKIINKYGYF